MWTLTISVTTHYLHMYADMKSSQVNPTQIYLSLTVFLTSTSSLVQHCLPPARRLQSITSQFPSLLTFPFVSILPQQGVPALPSSTSSPGPSTAIYSARRPPRPISLSSFPSFVPPQAAPLDELTSASGTKQNPDFDQAPEPNIGTALSSGARVGRRPLQPPSRTRSLLLSLSSAFPLPAAPLLFVIGAAAGRLDGFLWSVVQ